MELAPAEVTQLQFSALGKVSRVETGWVCPAVREHEKGKGVQPYT